ncbi:protein unc-93 homolog A-like isoform X2 [Mytilus edulis]|uniref:protein unc-93 homolog A-like isoform X2 n=1 Tax=Mytilus edulis TaxID=6550 RepID=UPI0039EEE868
MEEESMEETMQMEQLNGGNQIDPSSTSNDEPSPENTEPPPMGRVRILKNVFVVSIGFMFLFTSFQSLSNLQSTLNKDEGLGTGGLAVVYGALVVSCMLLPSFVIAHLGCKWTVTLSMLCYIAYMALNFHAIWGTIIPASIIVGLGGGTLWAAKCAYLTQIAVWYAKLTGAKKDDVMNKFFGFFFMTCQTSDIWGNIISSTVFAVTPGNTTNDIDSCGANFDPTAPTGNNSNLDRPDDTKSYVSCTIGIWNVGYVMICFGAVCAICSWGFGRLVQFVGHVPFFIIAFLSHGGTLIALLLWQPNRDNQVMIYVFAGLWGIGDAVMQTQINALYGYLFTTNIEAAFSNYKLWESFGYIIAFAWSGYLVTKVKLVLCIGFLTVGMVLFTIVEIQDRRDKCKKGDFQKVNVEIDQ